MLTPNDVHFLVGLLTTVSRPDAIEVELGSMILDVAADEDRDVDIIVRVTNEDGTISAFEGIEVKDHTRPLDVAHVEQLCIKFNDMPSITKKGIVSASGYTEPAIQKAAYHQIDLFHLKTWDNPSEGFYHIQFAEGFSILELKYKWVDPPNIAFNPHRPIAPELLQQFNGTIPVFDQEGNAILDCPDVEALARYLTSSAVGCIEKEGLEIKVGEIKPISIDVDIEYHPYCIIDTEMIVFDRAIVSGNLTQIQEVTIPEFKILVKHGEMDPYVGCAVFEMSFGNLAAVTVDRYSRSLRWVNVPVSDRLKKKIYRRKLQCLGCGPTKQAPEPPKQVP